MKTITIDRRSWHWRLLNRLNWKARLTDDFCSYCRWLAWALVVCALGFSGVTFMAWCVVDAAMWIVIGLRYAFPEPMPGAVITITLLFFAALGGAAWTAINVLGHVAVRVPNVIPHDTKDFVASAWESLRDKMCFRVQLK